MTSGIDSNTILDLVQTDDAPAAIRAEEKLD